MRSVLQSLKEYQDVLLRIAELESLLSIVPPEIESLEKEWTAIKDRIEQLATRAREQESQLKEKQSQLEQAESKAKKFEEDLHQVTNTREYHAALKEIDSAKKQIHTLKENISSRHKELEEISANMEECVQLEKESRTRYVSQTKEHRVSQKDHEVELKEKQKTRKALAANIPLKVMKQFTRISDRRNGIGLSLCVSSICQACNVRVRHSVVAELRKYQRLISCDSCKRILFFEEEPMP